MLRVSAYSFLGSPAWQGQRGDTAQACLRGKEPKDICKEPSCEHKHSYQLKVVLLEHQVA